ncbi:ATP synthase F1 subunit delta [Vagococcus lutrae]|uniref:ATP synthase subunit delta n=1 Tax=Vagococcus lutrae LBD1 TaxID=1408226 RepID=V6Q675_9ENTE|nr:ATP synthase F1 subunit delta [Vagococcus lutrae]EST90619.1 ATP synthase F1, delta subunit [Vagococcus lutrae LBD1]MDT2802441.1 ATP synthase F1 subunit delta [Vagococcus lutrae]MDT2826780.1 ATP synthase F1 subunit delta [Vagococcus lutrae]MDT2842674.1 ATP synthase F1 subunit delta [Vagococcus lutrae]NKZ28406.1 F0F1 ATP synthase subunit delta [Vagococcus lutrae]
MKTENIVVDRKYGRILYEIAKKENQIEAIHDELLVLRDIYKEVPEIGQILTDDRLAAFEKADILHELDREFGETISKFLRVIYEYGRMNEIPEIIDEFEFFYYEDKGILVADVTSVVSLSEDEITRLKEEVKAMTDAEKVIIREKLDPSILGGLIVQVDHKMIDNSVKKQLKEMHKELLA